MESIFVSLHDVMLSTKTISCIVAGIGLVGLLGYWLFLTGRDESIRKF